MLKFTFSVGDRVRQVDDGFTVPFESGTITGINETDEGNVTFSVLWDVFDWETVNWYASNLELLDE